MQPRAEDRDFSAYNAAQHGRTVRPLAVRAVTAHRASGATSGTAVDLGAGAGIEALYLAEVGYHVHAYDVDASQRDALDALRDHGAGVTARLGRLEEAGALPDADIVLSCATLSFLTPPAFTAVWSQLRACLQPGGVVAVDLFGERDDWAAGTDGSFFSQDEIDGLVDGLEVLEREEREHDGRSFGGPKHWHVTEVIARRPVQDARSAADGSAG
ncbi:class I SAM-dependent methyltransferase [Brachybacterium timonense]|uniref:class I SAM-dependent methyltransferase n=1 Tax=Brachybacterium timonense TaxID=2050896 RepID=UPI000D0B0F0C|nr:class I SAM-dependent methyltransferase [Brachybacterium timonense]